MNKKKTQLIILIVAIVIFIALVVGLAVPLIRNKEKPSDETSTSSVDVSASSTDPTLPTNPIDFTTTRETNTDIYAWIKVPGTKIDHAVLQSHEEDDNFYINRDERKRRTLGGDGALYTQKHNSLDFTDPNTVIYGHHNSKGDSKAGMFTGLLKFKDEDFFKANKTIMIYIPGHILTYEIFAAYLYDDRHILNAFDNFRDDRVFSDYLKTCLNPQSMVRNVREGVELTTEDRIITLSTCYKWQVKEPVRYLVQGVLRNDEKTN